MKRLVVGVKDQRMVEHGRILGHTPMHRGLPKLNRPTPFLLPSVIQVDDQIDPPPPILVVVMMRKIGVDIQKAAAPRLMQPTTFQARIRLQTGNPSQLREPRYEL